MKLASYRSGRDGRLMVVSRDLASAAPAGEVVGTLQGLLDDWDALAPRVQQISDDLNAGRRPDARPFEPASCAAPLPRAYSWTDGSVFLSHMRLMTRFTGQKPGNGEEKPLIVYQGGSDTFLGPLEEIAVTDDDALGVDFEAEVGVILGDTPMACGPDEALRRVRLVTILNDVSLRTPLTPEIRAGFGPIVGKPSTAFAPVAVTPDELGDAWQGGVLNMAMVSHLNGRLIGRPSAGVGMDFTFGEIIAHLTQSRRLGAGAIVGSGTISNEQDIETADPALGGVGSACIAEVRTIEGIRFGAPRTPFMRFGDRVRIEMLDGEGRSVFGAIDQTLVRYAR